jgi:hypothetical protein
MQPCRQSRSLLPDPFSGIRIEPGVTNRLLCVLALPETCRPRDLCLPRIDSRTHFGYAFAVRAGPARRSLPNPARAERQQR